MHCHDSDVTCIALSEGLDAGVSAARDGSCRYLVRAPNEFLFFALHVVRTNNRYIGGRSYETLLQQCGCFALSGFSQFRRVE